MRCTHRRAGSAVHTPTSRQCGAHTDVETTRYLCGSHNWAVACADTVPHLPDGVIRLARYFLLTATTDMAFPASPRPWALQLGIGLALVLWPRHRMQFLLEFRREARNFPLRVGSGQARARIGIREKPYRYPNTVEYGFNLFSRVPRRARSARPVHLLIWIYLVGCCHKAYMIGHLV